MQFRATRIEWWICIYSLGTAKHVFFVKNTPNAYSRSNHKSQNVWSNKHIVVSEKAKTVDAQTYPTDESRQNKNTERQMKWRVHVFCAVLQWHTGRP